MRATKTNRPLQGAAATRRESDPAHVTQAEREAAVVGVLGVAEARHMTSAERMARFEKAMLLYEPSEQAAVVCGLIGGLEKGEIREAVDFLTRTESRGNYFPPTVWKALWNRWGRLDGEECFAYLQGGEALRTRNMRMKNGVREVGRTVMQGWLAADPEGAMSWAATTKHSTLEAAAAAMALTESAGGDLAEIGRILVDHRADSALLTEGLVDYFDYALLESPEQSAADIYQALPPELQAHAVRETYHRLLFANAGEAMTWLAENGPGGQETYQLATGYVHSALHKHQYAEGTKALARLPYQQQAVSNHPVMEPLKRWLQTEPEVAKAWLEQQPEDSPWFQYYQATPLGEEPS
ncbi:hypothetical protein [Roseibacillus ishigakijimensis]|uniref:Uncharacterized protein n=1 Tax=Roseibacillus ishigakijimensis TaxID=454146 RepID=A0A934RPP1_9BACT|nr:hypothetical protein [Roseibacillus ishigakijimensis]MBK1834668.1 hypothetical protein [Roseibacillus ishigakijimensis]